jgi:tripartite-type tricarboxylate transporter receptor subunit TctC
MVVTASLRASSVKEFIALAKAPQSRVNYASSGNGGSTHLLTELFKTMAGIDITHVPYNGAAPALNDLIGGQVQMLLAVPATAIPHMKSGRLRALAVSSVRRSPLVPELPTIAEAGVPGFEGATWYGVVAPARTPPAVVTQLNRDFLSALRTPDVRDRLVSQGVEIVGSTPDEFAQFVRNEIPKWAKAAQISGARVE